MNIDRKNAGQKPERRAPHIFGLFFRAVTVWGVINGHADRFVHNVQWYLTFKVG